MDWEISAISPSLTQALDQGTAVLARALSGSDLVATALAGALPILIALLARSPLNLLAAGVLVLFAFVLARDSEAGLAIGFYVAGWILALQGFAEARRRKTVRSIANDLSMLHGEVSAFLTALDRRSQMVDEARLRLVEPKLEQEKA